MTPDEYLDHLSALIAAERDDEALDLAARCDAEMRPRLSAEQIDIVSGMMESAELAVSIARALEARSGGQDRPAESAVRS